MHWSIVSLRVSAQTSWRTSWRTSWEMKLPQPCPPCWPSGFVCKMLTQLAEEAADDVSTRSIRGKDGVAIQQTSELRE
jgi:hypothetical protein